MKAMSFLVLRLNTCVTKALGFTIHKNAMQCKAAGAFMPAQSESMACSCLDLILNVLG